MSKTLVLTHLSWAETSAPWLRPATAGPVSTVRRGLNVSFRFADGRVTHGEVAPLPGLHRESLASVTASLERLAAGLPRSFGAELVGPVPRLDDLRDLPPSLSWCAATALLSAFEWTQAKSAPKSAALATAVDHATRAFDNGTQVVKMKIGRQSIDADTRAIDAITIPSGGSLRLDGNRRLSGDDAAALFAHLSANAVPIDFIEEPCKDPHTSLRLMRAHSIAIGVDETLAATGVTSRTDIELAEEAPVWVLKPALLGWNRTAALVRQAQSRKKRTVFSSTFELPVGSRALADFAWQIAPDEVHGLGTGPWLGGGGK